MDQRAAIMSRAALFAFAVVTLLAGCQTVQTTQPGVVGVDRKQHFLVSSDEMNAAAADAYKKTIAEAQAKGQLNTNPAHVEQVKRVVSRLIPNTGYFRPDAPKWAWEVNVLSTPEVNAWCMPGGKIAVYSGLLDKVKPTDDELAAVLGHEIAHALREHSREQMSQQLVEQIGLGVLGAGLGLSDVTQQLSGVLLKVGFELPHSRTDETEADRVGLELAARSGFDPHAAVTLWQKMEQVAGAGGQGGTIQKFLSDHPPTEQRLADMKANADKLQPIYLAAKK
jgi:predicted Zn-dependent protease